MASANAIDVDGHRIEISNADKVLFPEDGLTKMDLARYYERAGEHVVRHSAGRPLALQRFPNGIGEDGFFQKQASDWFPDWMDTVAVPTRDGSTNHVVLRSPADLVYLANLGTITPHTLLVDAGDLDEPTEVIVDLDPSTHDLGPVRAAAGRLRDLFEEIGLVPWVKTSGSRGLHIHVDLAPAGGFAASRALAEDVARVLVAAEPDEFTTAFHKKDRGTRLLLDVMRNAHGQHAVAPYCLRPLPGAPVAAPLEWDEALAPSFDPQRWTLSNLFRRLGQRDDPWLGRTAGTTTADEALDRLRAAHPESPGD